MKILIFLCFLFSLGIGDLIAQEKAKTAPKRNAITIGILQGGGGLLGIDYERLITNHWGYQIGAGLVSLSAGLTYHFEGTTNSNAVWIGTWNQGVPGSSLSSTYVGISYIMRGWNWLNGQIGIAYVPFRGADATANLKSLTGSSGDPPPFALLYSLGWYSGF